MNPVLERIGTFGIVPVVTIDRAEDAASLGRALTAGDLPVADPVGDGVVELHAHVSDHHVGKHSNQNRTGPHDDLRGESATSTRRSPMTRRGVRPTAARDRPRVGASLVAMRKFDVDKLVEGITQGNRALIAQSITLVESVKPAHRELAQLQSRQGYPRRD